MATACAKDECDCPTRALRLMQRPQIDEQARRDTEADEIGQRIELRAEGAVDMEQTRDTSVERIEKRRKHDGRQRRPSIGRRRLSGIAVVPEQSPSSVNPFGNILPIGEVVAQRCRGAAQIAFAHSTHPRHQFGKSASTVSPALTF